jgi:ubiquitin-protein ligase
MSAKRHRRLGKDIQEIIRTADPQIHIHLVDGSTHDVRALLIPLTAPYAGCMFEFTLKFPDTYPDIPPAGKCPDILII